MGGFSFASVILSYFMVGGGLFAGTLLATKIGIEAEYFAIAVMAIGAFAGGWFAARASRHSTILEPALGAVGVVATTAALAATTDLGKLIWAFAQDATIRFVATMGVTSIVAALVGALLSEKLLGEATRSSLPWILYSALATFGTCVLAVIFASIVFARRYVDAAVANGGQGADLSAASADQIGMTMLIGIAVGCLFSGLAIGASARTRPLVASLLGGGLGVAGFFALLATYALGEPSNDVIAGFAVLAIGGAIVTLLGALLGWAITGRKHADA